MVAGGDSAQSVSGGGNRVVAPRGLAAAVVLVALFGGLFAVFAFSARADSHSGTITIDCDSFEIELSNYGPFPNIVMYRADYVRDSKGILRRGRVGGDLFGSSWSDMMTVTPGQLVYVAVLDFSDPDGSKGRSFVLGDWVRSPVINSPVMTVPACDEDAITISIPSDTVRPTTSTTTP